MFQTTDPSEAVLHGGDHCTKNLERERQKKEEKKGKKEREQKRRGKGKKGRREGQMYYGCKTPSWNCQKILKDRMGKKKAGKRWEKGHKSSEKI